MELNSEMVKKNLKDIFYQVAPEVVFDNIKMDEAFRNQVEIDSLDLYKIITLIQKETGVFIPDTKVAELNSLNELVKYVLEEQVRH